MWQQPLAASQLWVEEAHSIGKANICVVEVAQTAECTGRQDNDGDAANTRQNFTMDVVLNYPGQAPAHTQATVISANQHN